MLGWGSPPSGDRLRSAQLVDERRLPDVDDLAAERAHYGVAELLNPEGVRTADDESSCACRRERSAKIEGHLAH
jgi:hypothetical protein